MMNKKDAFLELGHLVSNFYYVVNKVDDKIDDLVIFIEETEQQNDHVLKALGQEINDLKQSQEALKKDFYETIMKFCATEESDCDHLILQDGEVPERETKTEHEIFLVTQEIKTLYVKELRVIKQRKDLALRVCKSFPGEKGNVEKSQIHDIIVATSSNTKDDQRTIYGPLEKKSQDFRTWNLTEVMMKMYGFTLDKANKEERVIKNLKEAMYLASKKHRDLTKENFINEVLGKKKSKLEGLLQAINVIKNSSEIDKEVCEANELIMEWFYQIEREIIFLVYDLHFIVSACGSQHEEAKFRAYFIEKLLRLKRREHGRVPVVVYRILALLEQKVEGKERGLCCFKDEHKKEVLSKVYNASNQIYEMIWCSVLVLNGNSTLSNSGMFKKEKLLASAKIVERCDEEWRAIRTKINELLVHSSSPDSFYR